MLREQNTERLIYLNLHFLLSGMNLGNRDICDSEFWSTNLFWQGSGPILTSCFQQTVLVGIPCGFLWVVAAAKTLRKTPDVCPYPWTLLSVLKVVISAVLILLSTLEFGLLFKADNASPEKPLPLMSFISIAVKMSTYILALVLQVRQRLHGKLSSSTLFLFWLLLTVCEIWTTPVFQVFLAEGSVEIDSVQFIIGSLSFPFNLCQLILSSIRDPSSSYWWNGKKDKDPVSNQTLLSRWTFTYMNRLIWYGHRNIITPQDMEYFGSHTSAQYITERLLKNWKEEEVKWKSWSSGEHTVENASRKMCKRSGKPSLYTAVFKTMWPRMFLSGLIEIIVSFTILVPPLILDLLIQFADNYEPLWHGYMYAIALFLSSAVTTFLRVNNLDILIPASLVPRLGLSAVVYRKALKLSSAARRDFTVGEMCNFLSVDTQKVFDTVWLANLIWACPLRIIITGALVWQFLGVACLAGFAVMIVLMPITGCLTRRIQILQEKQMTLKDSRLRQLNEIFNGVKVLKLFAWELPFMEKIKGIRHEEVVILRRTAIYKAAITFLWIFAPFLIAICSFVTFVLISQDNVLTPSIAFVSLTLFTTLRQTLYVIPEVISKLVQCQISLRRLERFLLCEELDPDSIEKKPSKGNSIVIDNGTFSWSSEEAPYLKDIQITIPEGSLVAVVGRVGSGKSALLSAILGEIHKLQGSVNVKGSIAYVAQQAWIQNASLRNNILFLKKMDTSKYEEILEICCLRPDLKILPAGDLTEIGEKGVNLSGGQKQRVSLARAVYQNCDVYILDDPLSAVDSHVGAHIFNHVIGPDGKLKKKTRILVTHDLSILSRVDQILVLEGGRIVESGKYEDLMQNKGDFSAFVEEHLKNMEEAKEDVLQETTEIKEDEKVCSSQMSTEDLKKQIIRLGSRLSRSQSSKDPLTAMQKKKRGQYIEDEAMRMGKVKGDTYLSYFRNASYAFSVTMVMSYTAYQTFEIGSSFWLSAWTSDTPLPDGTENTDLRNTRITVYGLLGLGQGLCILLAAMVLAFASMRASILFHIGMLTSVLHSPMLFFDTTPIGRILNRFGKDINMVDVDIPEILNSIITSLMAVLGTLVVISIMDPLFIAIMMPLSVIYVTLQVFYMRTSRQIRRLTAITLSPILSCFSETVQGTSTIRAFQAQEHFIDREYKLLDDNARPFMNSAGLNRWLGLRLESIGCVVVFIAALLIVAERDSLNAGIVGLTLSYALSVSLALNTVVKHSTTLENRMVSVERINEYSVLPSEDAWQKDTDKQISKKWPTDGKVVFQNYSMSYQKNMDLVLKHINLNVKATEKVGIVGRTGSGKSSLALSLFRTVEAADGSITIDEFDIASLGLHTLRAGLTIIPQDPVLFSGSLRLNLDPLQQHADVDLWNSLDLAHLKDFVSSLDNGLDYQVTEGGGNLSVGQRQQLCLARALLKRTKVLILDEATAAMDVETDKLIQSTIRKEFQSSTIITIAHRLHTILDYDRIIVMDNGKVVEQGEPDALLQNQSTHFYRLGKDAGLL